MIDSLFRLPYKTPPLWVAVALTLAPLSARAEQLEGAQLPEGSHKVGEHRYRAPGNFDETKKYYKFVYPEATYPRRTIANQPGIRAVHIVNTNGKGFEGLNIYEANDEVRIYIVPEVETPRPVKKRVTGSSRRR